MLRVPDQLAALLLANAMMLLPLPRSRIELDCRVNAPMPAVLLVAPCSERPPMFNVPPFIFIVVASLMRSSHELLPLNRRVPPESICMLDVPLIRPELLELVLLISSVPACTRVVPV